MFKVMQVMYAVAVVFVKAPKKTLLILSKLNTIIYYIFSQVLLNIYTIWFNEAKNGYDEFDLTYSSLIVKFLHWSETSILKYG